ncbi:unnamed protein product [Medioppia subpectinata]|uniref:Uncharacterized protein n=1 Tax=Medioppia subpectinata TaxID=1979941 RepID=A0A7R9KNP9_9ACAR|nr:unnamed protein product [Medioppia subpectinata]CAG2106964.1 unnamed protein product [Medioppia subpectinata]
MNSAAVIGRQLRQQQTTGRVSGPLVPPQPFKGRARTPSHLPGLQGGRTYSPAAHSLGPDADKKFAQFAGQHPHEFYPHPAHRENHDKDKDNDKNKEDEPRLRCTWHCFCIALKALSGGIVLLMLGTVMSVVGFFAEPLAVDHVKLENGTVVPTIDPDTKQHLHNLTYVGPVVMGLGGIVIVAACVLTFEVRDTLGVKVVPVKPETAGTLGASTSLSSTVIARKLSSITTDSVGGKGRANAGALTLPLATISSNSNAIESTKRIHETIQETVFNDGEPILGYSAPKSSKPISSGSGSGGGGSSGGRHQQQVSKHRRRYSIADQVMPCLTSPSSGTSHLLSPNIETTYFGLPSPQDTELSDPEGCSLVVPSKWRSSRCSCSGSPSHSLNMDLYLEDNDPPVTVAIVEHQEYLLQQRYRQHRELPVSPLSRPPSQQQYRRPKILASMESDGLSSSASSTSSDDMFMSQKSHQMCKNYVNAHNQCYVDQNLQYDNSSDQMTTPLLRNSSLSPSKVNAPNDTSVANNNGQQAISRSNNNAGQQAISRSNNNAGQQAISRSNNNAGQQAMNRVNNNTGAIDKRFPLLRQGALGNGSVPSTTR